MAKKLCEYLLGHTNTSGKQKKLLDQGPKTAKATNVHICVVKALIFSQP
jgi:hypothetical protein